LTDEDDVLRGNTARVYRYAIKIGEPIGVREVQRALKLSSPRLASYHLEKLEEAGLLKKTPDGFVVDKLVLENFVRLRRLLIPRYFVYFMVFATAAIFQVILFRPSVLTREYLFATMMLFVAAACFAYETVTTLLKKRI
jgi:DNA-binding transcriptional ArsR family regulator